MLDFMTLCDGYKLDHRRQYPSGTTAVYSNFTARSSRVPGINKVVFFGLRYFLERYLEKVARETFFDRPRSEVLAKYQALLDGYLGPNPIGTDHIGALHELGYIPLKFWSVPEGTLVPLRVPMLTWQNTLPEFYWLTNYIETLLSTCLWPTCTSATTALRYRTLLEKYGEHSGIDLNFVDWQAHDFSFRGMMFPEAAALSGLAHLTSFRGTDCLPALQIAQAYYDHEGAAGGSVPATEHAVMCAGAKECELETFSRILDLYPSGAVSVVSDTWDLWHVHTDILPKLKERILARGGKLVIRPDSGNPVDILCGDPTAKQGTPQAKGVVELLWDIFGGRETVKSFRELDSHIGALYGDSITVERAEEICRRLIEKGFATSNVVLGVGSFTYQHVTRDTYGFAVKATWSKINGEERLLFKDPVTDDGVKKSAIGRFVVHKGADGLTLKDGLTEAQQRIEGDHLNNQLQLVWEDGDWHRHQTLNDIRRLIREQR